MRRAASSGRVRGMAWILLAAISLALALSADRALVVTLTIPEVASRPAIGLASVAVLIGVTEIFGRLRILRWGIWVRDRALQVVDVLNRRGSRVAGAIAVAVPLALDMWIAEESPPSWVQGALRLAGGFALLSLCIGPGASFVARRWVRYRLRNLSRMSDLNDLLRLHEAPGGPDSPFHALHQHSWGRTIVAHEFNRIVPHTTERLLEKISGFLEGKPTDDPDRVRLRRLLNDGPQEDIRPWLARKLQIDSAWGAEVLIRQSSEGTFVP